MQRIIRRIAWCGSLLVLGLSPITQAQNCGIGGAYFQATAAITAPTDATPMNRAEGLAFLVRAGQLRVDDDASTPYRDVARQDWFAPLTAAALREGVISPGTAFRPADLLTRAEYATMVTQLFQVQTGKQLLVTRGADVHNDDWFAESLHFLTDRAIAPLTADGFALPHQAITRCEISEWTWELMRQGGGLTDETMQAVATETIQAAIAWPTPQRVAESRKAILFLEDTTAALAVSSALEALSTGHMALQAGYGRQAEQLAQQAWHLADGATHALLDEIKKAAHALAQSARTE